MGTWSGTWKHRGWVIELHREWGMGIGLILLIAGLSSHLSADIQLGNVKTCASSR